MDKSQQATQPQEAPGLQKQEHPSAAQATTPSLDQTTAHIGVDAIETGHFPEIHYADIAALLLAFVSLLVTMLGIGIAFLSFFGWRELRSLAAKVAKIGVDTHLKSDSFQQQFQKVAEEIVTERMDDVVKHLNTREKGGGNDANGTDTKPAPFTD